MLLVAAISGTMILLRPAKPKRADLVLWIFADTHQQTYCAGEPSLVQTFRQRTGKDLDVQLIAYRALSVRLMSIFMSGLGGDEVPDLVEIEISQVGKFFRPPHNEIGLVPLNDLLEKSPWNGRIVESRLAPWSKDGVVYGIPVDVSPVTITYRKDLFDEAGVTDLAQSRTWPEFQQKCLKAQAYWHSHGHPRRWAMELSEAGSDRLLMMLLQRRVNLVDDKGIVRLSDPKVAQTLAFYARMIAGPRKIGSEGAGWDTFFAQDFTPGLICALFTPDWRVPSMKQFAPQVAGKVRMMQLPIFDDGDAPTSTWGGTMMGITRHCRDVANAWKVIQLFYLEKEGLAARRLHSNILPPVSDVWDDPAYDQPDDFYGGQPTRRIYTRLAGRVPYRYANPATIVAERTLSYLVIQARNYVESHPDVGDQDLLARCQRWLDAGAADVRGASSMGSSSECRQCPHWRKQRTPGPPVRALAARPNLTAYRFSRQWQLDVVSSGQAHPGDAVHRRRQRRLAGHSPARGEAAGPGPLGLCGHPRGNVCRWQAIPGRRLPEGDGQDAQGAAPVVSRAERAPDVDVHGRSEGRRSAGSRGTGDRPGGQVLPAAAQRDRVSAAERRAQEIGLGRAHRPVALSPWSKDGLIYGVPHDVHPVTITYRKDLFDEAGVTDLERSVTWREFQDKCLKAQAAWKAQGIKRRWALEMPEAAADRLVALLLQRGVNLVDDRNNMRFNDPIVAETLAFYAQMIAGPRKIAGDGASGDAFFSQDLAPGNLCALFTPDWRASSLRQFVPQLKGKLRMMKLPVFQQGDAPTTTWGGTMMGITRQCKYPDAAWEVIKLLYLRPEGLEAQEIHRHPRAGAPELGGRIYDQPDEFYGGQITGRLFCELAEKIPRRYANPASVVAEQTLGVLIIEARNYVASRGENVDEKELIAACQKWLDRGAEDVRRRVEQGRFE